MPQAGAHLTRGMRHAAPTEFARQIFNQTPAIIVVKPVFQIMQARKIFAGALAAAISILLDVDSMRSGVQFDSGSFSIRAKPSAISKNVQQSTPLKFTEGDSTRLSISRVKCL